MPLLSNLSQMSFASAIATAGFGSYLGLTPPNPNKDSVPTTGDSLHRLSFTQRSAFIIGFGPFSLLALHVCGLASANPSISPALLMHGSENGINTDLIAWSRSTAIPIVAILCVGVPLRLGAYTSLGKNFTFNLSQPDELKTTGIYKYVQHPSYTGLISLILGNITLLARPDGVLSCWVPPAWYPAFCRLWWICAPLGVGGLLLAIWTRVSEEERMLKAQFGKEWVEWHSSTARFVPWVF